MTKSINNKYFFFGLLDIKWKVQKELEEMHHRNNVKGYHSFLLKPSSNFWVFYVCV